MLPGWVMDKIRKNPKGAMDWVMKMIPNTFGNKRQELHSIYAAAHNLWSNRRPSLTGFFRFNNAGGYGYGNESSVFSQKKIRYRKKPRTTRQLALAAYKMSKRLYGQIETKYRDFNDSLTSPAGATGVFEGIFTMNANLIPPGTKNIQRIGRDVFVKSFVMNWYSKNLATTTGFRLVILWMYNTEGQLPEWCDNPLDDQCIFTDRHMLANYRDHRDSRLKYKILYDKIFDHSSVEAYTSGKIRLIINRKLTFSDDDNASPTYAHIRSGGIAIGLCHYDTGDYGLDINFVSRLYFQDA